IFRFRRIFAIAIGAMVIGSVVILSTLGCKKGIDFAGGIMIEFTIPPNKPISNNIAEMRSALEKSMPYLSFSIQNIAPQKFMLRVANIANQNTDYSDALDEMIVNDIKSNIISSLGAVTFDQIESVGPHVSNDLIKQAITGLVFACFAI